jgi:hypothetical protein
MPLVLVSAHHDDGAPLLISRPQTPPGISVPSQDDFTPTPTGVQVCDTDHGDGDWDDDIGWDEEEDNMPAEEVNGRKPNNGARIAALEGAVVEIRTAQRKQGETLEGVQTACTKTSQDTAQILAALRALGVGVAGPAAKEGEGALSLTTPAHPDPHVQVMRALQAMGPVGTLVLVYLITKGYL